MENIENEYAYGRVSDKTQNEARQMQAFAEYGIKKENIFFDKKSGKDFDREQYKLLKEILKRTKNNLLVIKSIDRLRKKLQRNKRRMARTNKVHRHQNTWYAITWYYFE